MILIAVIVTSLFNPGLDRVDKSLRQVHPSRPTFIVYRFSGGLSHDLFPDIVIFILPNQAGFRTKNDLRADAACMHAGPLMIYADLWVWFLVARQHR
jgi:hypothetical protein